MISFEFICTKFMLETILWFYRDNPELKTFFFLLLFISSDYIHTYNFCSWYIVLFFIYLYGCVRPFQIIMLLHIALYQLVLLFRDNIRKWSEFRKSHYRLLIFYQKTYSFFFLVWTFSSPIGERFRFRL